ncbi:hypothetical protein I6N91_07900 [Arthrobacter sp. MSA 4-2]|uniref:hypothetical protein n=1 Tax=Arthrobacter sp. MSA 4-2 TaxID=2794349 RepID=UPI0018E7DB39|nr:hypothetical protein [Arthrobacter sp. MSA 4-2]MBJ2120897.1 hypothetical protein [Arthrobacter sp. MSA 4-2]
MPSRNGLIALILKVALLVAAVVAVPVIAHQDAITTSLLPFLGAVAGATAVSLLRGYFRRGDIRLRAVRGQVVGFLRSGVSGAEGVPRRWKPGLATPSAGRLDFQPQIDGRGDEYGEPLELEVMSVGSERDIPLSQALFRMGPTWRVVELSTPGGAVELAGPARDLRKTAAVLRRSVTETGGTTSTG